MSDPYYLPPSVDHNVEKLGIRQVTGIAMRANWTRVPEGTT
jgi:hypothetical protein